MCGKFSQSVTWGQLVNASQPLIPTPEEESAVVTPMKKAHVLGVGGDGRRWVAPMVWGFLKDGRLQHIHARGETLNVRPTFRRPFLEGRGVIMVRSFNEADEPRPGRTRQWVIAPGGAKEIAIAVLFRKQEVYQGLEYGFVQVTTPANALIAPISDRMPAVLDPEAISAWLGEVPGPTAFQLSLLQPFEADTEWTKTPEDPAAQRSSETGGAQLSLF
ncbi:MAG: SOS response-associated peptidase family protein [Alphaproteobacteria bacterium]|nr:SOS response-associated peptidase family protein [Alphaproteobacteria bacterium]